jgi:hypothetical protein
LKAGVKRGSPLPGYEWSFFRYKLCKRFNYLPSEVEREDWVDLQELLIIDDAVLELEAKEQKKAMKRG